MCSGRQDAFACSSNSLRSALVLLEHALLVCNTTGDKGFFLYNVTTPLMDRSAPGEAYRLLQKGVDKPLDRFGVVVHGLATLCIHILVIFPNKLPSGASPLHSAASIYSCARHWSNALSESELEDLADPSRRLLERIHQMTPKEASAFATPAEDLFRAISECAPLANIPYWGAPIANIR